MNKLEFTITIGAPREKVWKTLWDDNTYREWTAAFQEGSYAVSDWKEGSSIQFLDPRGSGMYSIIERRVDPEYMEFKHLGVIKDGKELPLDEETKQWSGGRESYWLSEENGVTTLKVIAHAPAEFVEMFNASFEKGLATLKQLSEK